MRSFRALALVMVTSACSNAPSGVLFKCETAEPRCPSGLVCTRIGAEDYCTERSTGPAGGGMGGGAAGGSAGGGAGGTAGGGAAGGTAGGTSGGTAGGTSGGTAGGTSGGTAGGTSGGTAGGTSGGTSGGTAGGTSGGTAGGTSGGTAGGTSGGTAGGSAGGCALPPLPADSMVYVSTSGNNMSSGLTPATALASIDVALMRLANMRDTVAIMSGTYSTTLRLSSGTVRLVGVTTTGARTCDAMQFPVLQSPTPTGLEVDGGLMTLDQLRIVASAGTSLQPSSYGAHVRGGNVTFTDVILESGDGFNGQTPAQSPMPMASSCQGMTDCLDGGVGPEGTPGAPSDGGGFDATGYLPGRGSPGTPGLQGRNGTASMTSTYGNCTGCSGSTPCVNGNLFCGTVAFAFAIQSVAGLCGCGGTGAVGGQPGPGGGASIALLLSGSSTTVTFVRGSLRSRQGGQGAGGGQPSAPRPGTTGTAGQARSCVDFAQNPTCGRARCNDNCEPSGPPATVTSTMGGTGGTGGTGGLGGSGSGGPSIGWVRVGGAMVTVSPQTTVTPGPGGLAPPGAQPGLSVNQLSWP
jgi:hypothetical protein